MPSSRTFLGARLHLPRRTPPAGLARLAYGLVACALAGCAGADPGSGVVGLPADEFQIAHNAGLDVAAAEHCGTAVDAGLVRHRLVEEARRRGLPDEVAEKSGRAFDKTRSEFSRRLAKTPGSCPSGPAVSAETLAQSGKGEFSAPPPDGGGPD